MSRPELCRVFIRFQRGPQPLDTLIADGLGVSDPTQTRSIALVIGVSRYPHLGSDLTAAAVDLDKLVQFLTDDQQFNDVILLRDEDATADNIEYFLGDYLPNRAGDFPGKGRLLIAYTGHGTDQTPTSQAAFVLSGATSPTDTSHIYRMSSFASNAQDLAPLYFHVLTLINACYGGHVFPSGNAGNADGFSEPGSHAITAGPAGDVTTSLRPERGSVFFDLLIDAIRRGVADPQYKLINAVAGGDGQILQSGGMTRTGALSTYLTSSYDAINRRGRKADPRFKPLSRPWSGPVEPVNVSANGGFFFLSPLETPAALRQVASVGEAYFSGPTVPRATFNAGDHAAGRPAVSAIVGAALGSNIGSAAMAASKPATGSDIGSEQIAIPPGPISSIKGRPDLKIFKAPALYPVKGIDLSSAEGRIDWARFARTPLPRFIYARAVGWSGPDKSYPERAAHIRALGLDHGPYVKFDFCVPVQAQLDSLVLAAPPSPDLLPVGVELVTPERAKDPKQARCYVGGSTALEGRSVARDHVIEFANAIRQRYGKTPILMGNRFNLSELTDARGDAFMLWLNAFGSQGSKGLQLAGRNPWTVWQYTGTANVPGIGHETTAEVFFGTSEQHAQFKQGQVNVGLAATR